MSKLKEPEKLLTQGSITRREFISRVSALGLTAAVSPVFFKSPAQAATPKKGGRFRLGLAGGSTTDSLDPATITDMMLQVVNQGQLRNTLVEIDHKAEPIPELAESWEATPDAKKWVFKLRKGVEFHNGKTMDADDVIYSINHHRGKDTKSAAKGIIENKSFGADCFSCARCLSVCPSDSLTYGLKASVETNTRGPSSGSTS